MIAGVRQNQFVLITVFSLTLFLSAALMFMLQPMIGRMLMPLIGGTPAGWIVALAFFQIMLLGGYYLAHALAGMDVRKHGIIFMVLLAVGALFLPVNLARHADIVTEGASPLRVFLLLTLSLAVPFVVLSATSSTIQRLFTATSYKTAHDPFFLYAASNLGSFAGLLTYPFVIERLYGVSQQTQYWMHGFIALIVMTGITVLLTTKREAAPEGKSLTPVTREQKIKWALLAFVPSSLMMGVTTHIATDIFAAPLIWIFPLGFYLLTFVIAFARYPVPEKITNILHPVAVIVGVGVMLVNISADFGVSWQAAALHVFCFAIVALACHTTLARLRPAGENVTEFYLMLAVGGALGGVLNAFIVPFLLNRAIEYPLMMMASLMLHPGFRKVLIGNDFEKKVFIAGAAAFVLYMVSISLIVAPPDFLTKNQVPMRDIANGLVVIIVALALLTRNVRTVCVALFLTFMVTQLMSLKITTLSARNFYGVVKIFDLPFIIDGGVYTARSLSHGSTTHGMQIMNPLFEVMPTTYYTKAGPVGDVFNFYGPKEVAVVGVGAGTMNCFSAPGRSFTFIDIDKDIVEIAKEYFTFLTAPECRGARPVEIVIGDGRLALERMEDRIFDVILVDAFSADTVPIHMLTQEAMEVYLSRLAPEGLILFNVSNRYFNLGGAIAQTAASMGLHSRMKIEAVSPVAYGTPSVWMVVGRGTADFGPLDEFGWGIMMKRSSKPWTDDYVDLIDIMQIDFFGLEE